MAKILSCSRSAHKRGFTLLEMMVVLALMALVLAIALPNVRRQMDWAATQSAFFEFQTRITDLRAAAFHQGEGFMVVSTGQFEVNPETAPREAEVLFADATWTYLLSNPMEISPGGVCAPATADLFQNGRVVMRLQSQADCRFVRLAL